MLLFNILRENKVSFVYCIILITLPVLFSSTLTILAFQYEELVSAFGIGEWLLFYVLASVSMGFALTPTTFISILSGYFIGWYSITGVIPSYMLAASICYFLAKFIDRGKFLHSLRRIEKVNQVIRNLHQSELKIIFLSKISPFLPFVLSNYLLSISGASFKKFLLGSLLGMLPRTLLAIWSGIQLNTLTHNSFSLSSQDETFTWLMVLVGILAFGGLFFIFQNALKTKNL